MPEVAECSTRTVRPKAGHRARIVVPLLALAATAFAGTAHARGNAVVGAAIGAGTGALIGQAMGGQDAAIVGGMIGAFAGAAVGANTRVIPVSGRGYGYGEDRRGGPGVVYGPPPGPAYRSGYGPVVGAGYGPVHVVPTYRYAPPPVYVAPRVVHAPRGYWQAGYDHRGRPIRTWVVIEPVPRYVYGYR